jgi:hypothetical protein
MADAGLRLLPESLVGVLDDRFGVLAVDQAREVRRAVETRPCLRASSVSRRTSPAWLFSERTVITSPGGFIEASLSTERLTCGRGA